MTKYKCGHITSGVIVMDSNELSMTAYIQWAEEENNLKTKEQCFDCYLNHDKDEEEKEVKRKKSNRWGMGYATR